MVMNVCGIKEHEFQVFLNKKILVIASILTLIFDIFSGGVFLRQHGIMQLGKQGGLRDLTSFSKKKILKLYF